MISEEKQKLQENQLDKAIKAFLKEVEKSVQIKNY